MPKIKTRRGALKRFKVTAAGKVKRSKAFKSHLLSSKSTKRKRRLRKGGLVAPTQAKTIRKLIPYL
jgi:large subunit ribosomal protein L35